MSKPFLPLALIAIFAMAGCATTTDPSMEGDADGTSTGEGTTTGDGSATATGTRDCPPTCDFARNAIDDPESMLSDRTIYFAFDSSNVQDEYMAIIQRHAAYLAQYPGIEVRVEGHSDERGSREYNIGLGARRADSVSRLLQVNGASNTQVETVSYGEEVPAAEGHDESAWSQNRRVELVYPSSN